MATKTKVDAKTRGRSRPTQDSPTAKREHKNDGAPEKASLRPERIQLKADSAEPAGAGPATQGRLSEEEIETAMAELPGWRLAADRRSIGCALQFPAYPMAVVFLNLVTGSGRAVGLLPGDRRPRAAGEPPAGLAATGRADG